MTASNNESIFSTPLIRQTEQLNLQLERTILILDSCLDTQQCEEVRANLNDVLLELNSFKAIAALDKKQVSLVGAVEYSNLQVAINRFFSKLDVGEFEYRQLKQALNTNYVEIRNRFDDLFFVEHQHVLDTMKTSVNVIIAIFPLLSVIATQSSLAGGIDSRRRCEPVSL
ncbi:putative sensory box sensor histidine kinase/response regulator [Vibrio variabilis]|uniref:Sensory box sensor histidine kinase/response regulator n=1 Tax=Vibrio variabilis TaxID=990271 RepID=A0ABQ0J9V9_9VIBR|nr:putative sensory box sensor histidine kinase/response regulator [Vibrio variabilis]